MNNIKKSLLGVLGIAICSISWGQCPVNETINFNADACINTTSTFSLGSSENGIRYVLRDSNNCQVGDTVIGTAAGISFATPTLTQTGSYTYNIIGQTPGNYHNGLNFDGIDDFVDMGDQPQLDFTNTSVFTIEAWVKLPTVPVADFGQILSKTDNAGGNTGWGLQMQQGKPELYLMKDFGATDYIFVNVIGVNLLDDTWHHVAVSYDGSSDASGIVFYIDGVKTGTNTGANSLTGGFTNIGDFHVGNYRGFSNNYYFTGGIDELRIWNSVKTQKEICTNMRTYLNGTEAGLISFWNFNEGIASTATDLSINNLNGTLTNMLPSNWVAGAIDSVLCTTQMSVKPVVTVHPNYNLTVNEFICNGDSVLIGGIYRKGPGTFVDNLSSQFGCDSILIKSLSVKSTFFTKDSVFICNGDSALIFGIYQKVGGFYYDSLQSVITGCDSVFETKLILNNTLLVSSSVSICAGDSSLIFGSYQSSAGFYYDSLQTGSGCDSVFEVQLIVNDFQLFSSDTAICMGDSILLFGVYQSTVAIYYDSLQTTLGCDSVFAINLTVNNLPDATIDTIIGNLGANTFCQFDSPFQQLSASTTNGVFSGLGVVGDSLNLDSLSFVIPNWVLYTVMDANFCISTDSIAFFKEICGSVKELSQGSTLSTYPNPTRGAINIDLSEFSNQKVEVKIIDITGKKVKAVRLQGGKNKELNLSKLAKGIYQITVRSENKFSTAKVVLE